LNACNTTRARSLCLMAIALILPLAQAFATCPDQEFNRTLNRDFGTTANGMVALYNQYGKLNVKTWNENRVKIDITIVVNATDQRAADRIFDRIKINFTNTAGYVKAETMIEKCNGCWDNGDFRINYDVYMPVGNQLDLKNKYGNAYVANLNGKLTAEIKYGDLRTETLQNDADLSLGYGKANILSVRNLYGQVSYGQLSVGASNDVQMDTKYSEIRCDRANALRLTSKYDDFNLGAIDDLRLQTKYADVKVNETRLAFVTASYTDVAIEHAHEVVDVNLTYGNLKVANLDKNFQSFNAVSKYTDINVMVETGAVYRFDGEGSYTDFHYPKTMTPRQHLEDGSMNKLVGYMGNANAKGLVKVRMGYGDLMLK